MNPTVTNSNLSLVKYNPPISLEELYWKKRCTDEFNCDFKNSQINISFKGLYALITRSIPQDNSNSVQKKREWAKALAKSNAITERKETLTSEITKNSNPIKLEGGFIAPKLGGIFIDHVFDHLNNKKHSIENIDNYETYSILNSHFCITSTHSTNRSHKDVDIYFN